MTLEFVSIVLGFASIVLSIVSIAFAGFTFTSSLRFRDEAVNKETRVNEMLAEIKTEVKSIERFTLSYFNRAFDALLEDRKRSALNVEEVGEQLKAEFGKLQDVNKASIDKRTILTIIDNKVEEAKELLSQRGSVSRVSMSDLQNKIFRTVSKAEGWVSLDDLVAEINMNKSVLRKSIDRLVGLNLVLWKDDNQQELCKLKNL